MGATAARRRASGSYETYRYGLRWFGDYRGAVRGVDGPTFCLDLRFWYPGRAYDYEPAPAEGLRNRDGDRVAPERLRRMSYAMWNYGRTDRRANQGAVMLYVHRMMGDGAPGEVDPSAAGPAVGAVYDRIARNAERFAGPYRVELRMPKSLPVRRRAALSVRVLSASGRAVPNARVTLDAAGAGGLPARVDTGDDGVARPASRPATSRAASASPRPASGWRHRCRRSTCRRAATPRATASASRRPPRRR